MKQTPLLDIIKDFLFPLFIALTIVILTLIFLIPKINQIIATKSEIEKQQKSINLLSQKLAELKSLSEAELLSSSSLLLEALPVNKDFYKILILTKRVFSENGTTLTAFDFSPGIISTESGQEQNDQSNNILSVKAAFSSSYESFGNLLDGFTKALPLMEVDSIKFGSLSATSSASLPYLEGVLNVKSYYSPLPKELGKIESPLPKISASGINLVQELKSYRQFIPEFVANEQVVVGKENPFP